MNNVCICERCGTFEQHKTETQGSIGTELLLWCLFLVPGIIYTAWRLTTRKDYCTACGSDQLIPVTIPRGRDLHNQYHPIRTG